MCATSASGRLAAGGTPPGANTVRLGFWAMTRSIQRLVDCDLDGVLVQLTPLSVVPDGHDLDTV